MKTVMKIHDTKEGGYVWEVVLLKVGGVGSECRIIKDDVIWLLSGEAFAFDTFVFWT